MRINALIRIAIRPLCLISLAGILLADAGAATLVVEMVNYEFVPRDSTVQAGDTVTWTNLDQDFHTSTSGNNGAPSGLWDSGLFGPGGSFSFTFNVAPGRYDYYCAPHFPIGMVGSVTVLPSSNAPPSVAITQPTSGATFAFGSHITLSATVNASGALVTNVLFLADGSSIGSVDQAPFAFSWAPTQPRAYSLNAVTFDNSGQASTSAPVAIRVFIPDSQRPTVAVKSSPPQFARLKTPSISLAGTAGDDIGLDKVLVQVNGGPPQTATGTTSWQAEILLPPGNNTLRITSVDQAGNASFPVTRYVTYVATTPLTVQVNGAGTVTPDLTGRALEIGKVYTMAARPQAGQLFAGWSGPANTNNPRLSFQMQSNLVLIANFAPNRFPSFAGAYRGLFSNPDKVFPANSGALELQLGKTGSFSGKVTMNGANYPFHGQFNPDGNVTVPVLRPTLTPLLLTLELDFGGGVIKGMGTDGDAGFSLLAERRATPTSSNGQRSFVLQRAPNEGGTLVATAIANISSEGNVRISGRMADARKFSFATALSKQGDIPFYVPFGQGSEIIIGWIHLSAGSDSALAGNLVWTKTGAEGFSIQLEAAPATQ